MPTEAARSALSRPTTAARLCAKLGERAAEDVERLRSENDELPVEDECRDCIDSDRLRLPRRVPDGIEIHGRICDHRLDVFGVQTHLRSEPSQLLWLAHIRRLGPIGVHQAVVKGLVQPTLTSELRHAERELRVRNDLRPVVLQAYRRKPLAKRVLIPDAVAPMKLGESDAFWRVLGVQIERQPQDVGVELAP